MFMQSGDGDCGPGHAKKSDMTRYYCAISEIYYRIPSGLDSSKVTDEVSRFYADPRNVPVRWEAAVVISEAMLSGTKVTDEDLDTIRSYDAKATASLKQWGDLHENYALGLLILASAATLMYVKDMHPAG